MDAVTKELLTLRVSVARLAQTLNVDNRLGVTGKPYEELCALAMTQNRGWNGLLLECVNAVQERA